MLLCNAVGNTWPPSQPEGLASLPRAWIGTFNVESHARLSMFVYVLVAACTSLDVLPVSACPLQPLLIMPPLRSCSPRTQVQAHGILHECRGTKHIRRTTAPTHTCARRGQFSQDANSTTGEQGQRAGKHYHFAASLYSSQEGGPCFCEFHKKCVCSHAAACSAASLSPEAPVRTSSASRRNPPPIPCSPCSPCTSTRDRDCPVSCTAPLAAHPTAQPPG